MIFSHHALEAFACPARGADNLKPRHSISGPMRGGSAWHAWAKLYLEHLLAKRVASDWDQAAKLWAGLRGFLSPDEEQHMNGVAVEFSLREQFDWLLEATDVEVEVSRFFTAARQEVPADKVHGLTSPVMRVTADLSYRGAPPSVGDAPGHCLHVVDWKTNWVVEHVDSPNNNRQLRRYAAALMGPDDACVCVWLCFPRRKVWECQTFYRDELLRDWEDLVRVPMVTIAAGGLRDERVVGVQCMDCSMRNGCDAALRYPYLASGVEDLSPEDAVVALHIADDIVSQMSDRIRARLAITGQPIHAGSHTAQTHETRKATWVNSLVRKELDGLGLAPEHIELAFSCTQAGIKAALSAGQVKGIGVVMEEIKEKMPVKVGDTLDVGRAKKTREKKAAKQEPAPTLEGMTDEQLLAAAKAIDEQVGEE